MSCESKRSNSFIFNGSIVIIISIFWSKLINYCKGIQGFLKQCTSKSTSFLFCTSTSQTSNVRYIRNPGLVWSIKCSILIQFNISIINHSGSHSNKEIGLFILWIWNNRNRTIKSSSLQKYFSSKITTQRSCSRTYSNCLSCKSIGSSFYNTNFRNIKWWSISK